MIPRFVDDKLRLLTSYHYAKTVELDTFLDESFDTLPELFYDSGAFSAFTKGVPIKVEEYAEWLHRWKHFAITYANLDVIKDWRGTVNNLKRLQDLGLNPLPVYHGGSPTEILEELCEQYNYIAVGGITGARPRSNDLMRNLSAIFRQINGRVSVHGFGALDMKMQKSFQWYSADSTTWLNGHRYGKIRMFDPRSATITDFKVRQAKGWGRAAYPLRVLGLDWRDFAFQKEYAPNKDIVTRLAIIAYKTAEQFIHDVWGENKLCEDTQKEKPCGIGPGPKVYLAITPASMKVYLSKQRAKGDGMDMATWLKHYAATGEFYP